MVSALSSPPLPPPPGSDGEGISTREEVVEGFARLLQGEGRSPWTVKQYSFTARHFLSWLDKPLPEVVPADLERWREYLVLQRGYAKSSVYASLRAVAALLRASHLRAAEGVVPPKRPQKLPTFLSESETEQLLAAAAADAEDEALVRVLVYGGLRVGEVCRLSWDDVDREEGLLKVRAGKGDKDRFVVVEESTLASLDRLRRVREETPAGDLRVFPVSRETVERRVHALALEAGLHKHVTPHTLRHTLATALLRHGLDLRFIQKQLGHASVATTQLYTHVDTDALKEAYRAAAPSYRSGSSAMRPAPPAPSVPRAEASL